MQAFLFCLKQSRDQIHQCSGGKGRQIPALFQNRLQIFVAVLDFFGVCFGVLNLIGKGILSILGKIIKSQQKNYADRKDRKFYAGEDVLIPSGFEQVAVEKIDTKMFIFIHFLMEGRKELFPIA